MSPVDEPALARRLGAEFLGTGFLLAAVVGSGIMGIKLAGGNIAIALLANSIATGAMLVVLITIFGPISGGHFNPAVTLAFRLRGDLSSAESAAYVAVQVAGGLAGLVAAHVMFEETLVQASTQIRTGPAQWFAEGVATFGLVVTILLTRQYRPALVAANVGLYVMAAYWFTASTSFANPAVTIARAYTDTFAGIRAEDVAPFVAAQIVGAIAAYGGAMFLGREAGSVRQDAPRR